MRQVTGREIHFKRDNKDLQLLSVLVTLVVGEGFSVDQRQQTMDFCADTCLLMRQRSGHGKVLEWCLEGLHLKVHPSPDSLLHAYCCRKKDHTADLKVGGFYFFTILILCMQK
ncbi:hypothetical protein JOB18_015570 [Solea senegalensis]|uniref:Uncharacterized protein n=1 Tax=Solea senegalensis TaxID=28829 RepID=A0AAV6T5G9_SOLSE|nr:hypothetical protein JOB18_015570 [Solea senegalensis]